MGCEVIGNVQRASDLAELQDSRAVVLATVIGIEVRFPRGNVNIALTVGGRARRLPNGSQTSFRRRIEDADPLKSGPIVAKHPAVRGVIAAIRAKGNVEKAIVKQQGGSVQRM